MGDQPSESMGLNETAGAAFRWGRRQVQAAVLVAKDEQSDEAIAAACKVGKATLERWKHHPEFATRVDEYRARLRAEIEAKGIADLRNRVEAQNDRHARLQRVIDARAEEHAEVPGGETGLLVRQVKLVKMYGTSEPEADEELEGQPHGGALRRRRARGLLQPTGQSVEVAEYAVDTGLLKEMRELEKLVAEELGQRQQRITVTRDVVEEARRIAEELGITVEQVLREAGIDAGAGALGPGAL